MNEPDPTLYDRVADLALEIEDFTLERRERETSSGFTRTTTVIAIHGNDVTGCGEDVTYDGGEHDILHDRSEDIHLDGRFTIDTYSAMLGDVELFPAGPPERSADVAYRRWGFESAALDLALKQRGQSLAEALGRTYRPVRFVVSTRLGDAPSMAPVERLRRIDPSLEFKLDATSEWTPSLVAELAESGAVVSIDLKGQYEGTIVDQSADPELYELVFDGLPGVIVEDPGVTPETRPLLEAHTDRLAWDYPITGIDSIEELPWEPTWINIKPSRFGTVRSLLRTIAYCLDNDVRLYGGGQFELDVGRQHLHALASLFYPDGPNDVAPIPYYDPEPTGDIPTSPLSPPNAPTGLEWVPGDAANE